jgi:hypothetical protein
LDAALPDPMRLAAIYLVGALSLLAAVVAARSLIPGARGWIAKLPDVSASPLWIAVTDVAIAASILEFLAPDSSLVPLLSQLQRLIHFSMLGAVTYRLAVQGGRRFWGAREVFYVLVFPLYGIPGLWKGAMMTPVFVLTVAILCAGTKLALRRLLMLAALASPVFFVYLPLARLGHDTSVLRGGAIANNRIEEIRQIFEFVGTQVNVESLADKAATLDEIVNMSQEGCPIYGQNMGFISRLTVIGADCALLTAIGEGNFAGTDPIWGAIQLVPGKLSGKSVVQVSNVMGRFSKILDPGDWQTGVAFTMFMYHYAVDGWWSLVAFTFASAFVFFAANRFFFGTKLDRADVRTWIPLPFALFALVTGCVADVYLFVARVIPELVVVVFGIGYLNALLNGKRVRPTPAERRSSTSDA